MSKTNIEWAERVWNPFAGCSILSPGCANCYAMKMARRIEACNVGLRQGHGGSPHYAGTTKVVNGSAVWTGTIGIASDEVLTAPLKRKKPTTYFVNSMSDLFHEAVPDEWIDKVFAVMALTPQHTYQILTKRSARMRAYLNGIPSKIPFLGRMPLERIHLEAAGHMEDDGGYMDALKKAGNAYSLYLDAPWPLPNVWLGVSTERQQEYDRRAPDLRETPAAVKFFSMEPLLGPITAPWLGDWCIVGGESGPGVRPMHPDWARSIRDQCAAAGVPFFFKQWGNWIAGEVYAEGDRGGLTRCADGQPHGGAPTHWWSGDCWGGTISVSIGKKAAGRLLDGVTHDAMPDAAR